MIDRRSVARAGHLGDVEHARAGLTDDAPSVRATALGALARLGALDPTVLDAAFADPDPTVRRRAAQLAAAVPGVGLLSLLSDADPIVVEMAAWSCGERESVDDVVVDRLIEIAGTHRDPLAREAAVAAIGAIGDERGLPAVLAACSDKPAIRRRAVIALAPFDGPEVEAALERALDDKDWQVRDAAEELLRAGIVDDSELEDDTDDADGGVDL